MRLTRYPGGANEWCLHIWHRHPRWSMTWTHGIALTKHRPESSQRRWGFYHMPGPLASRSGVTVAGYDLALMTQKPMRRGKE